MFSLMDYKEGSKGRERHTLVGIVYRDYTSSSPLFKELRWGRQWYGRWDRIMNESKWDTFSQDEKSRETLGWGKKKGKPWMSAFINVIPNTEQINMLSDGKNKNKSSLIDNDPMFLITIMTFFSLGCTVCMTVFAACPEQADHTGVSVQHMLAVHWGRFTSLRSRLLQQRICYDRIPVSKQRMSWVLHGRGLVWWRDTLVNWYGLTGCDQLSSELSNGRLRGWVLLERALSHCWQPARLANHTPRRHECGCCSSILQPQRSDVLALRLLNTWMCWCFCMNHCHAAFPLFGCGVTAD